MIGGIFLFVCPICISVVCIWLKVRRGRRQRSTPSVIPVTGRRVVVITQRTNTATRPPGAPPLYMPPQEGPSPPYSGPVEPVIPDKDENDDGDDVPLLSGN